MKRCGLIVVAVSGDRDRKEPDATRNNRRYPRFSTDDHPGYVTTPVYPLFAAFHSSPPQH